jgi:hypothetical protein
LVAGIVPAERAARMVREHLLNEDEFWGEYVLPSIARSDPGYRKGEVTRAGIDHSVGDYWRGRIWGPMNFLVGEGLRRCGFDLESHEFARKSVRLFQKEWNEENHVHENYNDLSGEGDDVSNANALYHWGSLLAYLGIQELADCEAWEGWRFGCLSRDGAGVTGIALVEGRLDVETGPQGLRVSLDGQLLLESDTALIVKGYRTAPNQVRFRLSGMERKTRLTIGYPGGLPRGGQVEVRIREDKPIEPGQGLIVQAGPDGTVQASLPVPCQVELTW